MILNTFTSCQSTHSEGIYNEQTIQKINLTLHQRSIPVINSTNMENNGSNFSVEKKSKAILLDSTKQNQISIILGMLIRLIVPVCSRLVKGLHGIGVIRCLHYVSHLKDSTQIFTNLIAYAANIISLNLAVTQVSQHINPILRIRRIKKDSNKKPTPSSDCDSNTLSLLLLESDKPEKCVTLDILAEPPSEKDILVDVIFIHGLRGSTTKTWKQGLWSNEGRLVYMKKKLPTNIRKPKRSRCTQNLNIHRAKKPRLSIEENYEETNTESFNDFEFFTYHLLEVSGVNFPTSHLNSDEVNEFVCSITNSKSKITKTSSNYSLCWPRDWLPLDCPGARVIAVNYTTDPYLWRPFWSKKRNRTSIIERAREITDLLIKERVGNGHPIVWVGHSKGGLYIKQIIVDAYESKKLSTSKLWQQSKGVLFYSVPHRGSALADFNLPFLRQSIELSELKKNSPALLDLHERFVALYLNGYNKINVFSFAETSFTLMLVIYLRIVSVDSADPGIGEICNLRLDHREICKPRSRNCILYTQLVKMIKNLS